jgi:hypothetical protein
VRGGEGGHHGSRGPVSNLGLSLYVYGDSVGAGHVHDLLNGDGLVLDHINMLNYLLGYVDVTYNLYLHRGIDVLDDINGLVDNFGLVDGVGSVNINDLDGGHVADLFDLNNLGYVLDDFNRGINILGNRDVADFLACLSHDFGNVTDDFEFASLSNYLGHVSDDFLYLGYLNVLDGDRYVHGHGGLNVLNLGDSYRDLTNFGDSLDDGDLNLLFNDLVHMDGAVNNNLAGDLTNLRNFDLNRARDLTMLNNLNRYVLVDDLWLWDLNYTFYGDRACDLLGYLNILDDSLDLHLRDFYDSLYRSFNILDLWHFNDALLCDDLGNVNNALLGDDLALDHLYGSMVNGGMD